MNSIHSYHFTVAISLVVILCGTVSSDVTDFSGIDNDELFTQIQQDMIAMETEFGPGQPYYLLVLKVNEAVTRKILTRVPNREEVQQWMTTSLYKVNGIGTQLRFPSTDEVSKAKKFFDIPEQPFERKPPVYDSHFSSFQENPHDISAFDYQSSGAFQAQEEHFPPLSPNRQEGRRDNKANGYDKDSEEANSGCFGRMSGCLPWKKRHRFPFFNT